LIDILDKTLALGVGGVTSPSMTFAAAGKEIFDVPHGGGGVLGDGLTKAIANVFKI
jgi:hypothetical protein